MLKTRILTGSILLTLCVTLILFSNYNLFAYITAGIIILAAYEWFKLLHIKNNLVLLGFLIIFITILTWLIFNYNFVFKNDYLFSIFIINILLWLLNILLIIRYSINKISFHNFCLNYPVLWKTFSVCSCLVVLIPSWLAINYIKHNNSYYLLGIIFMIISIDCGGYFGGKFLGKHKLSIVSPNKTWEGVLVGYLIVILIMLMFFKGIISSSNKQFYSYTYTIVHIIIFTHVFFILAIIGDLFESLLKRISKVKDSGNILPGHGGILDRLDSILAVMPIAALAYLHIY